MKQSFRCKAKSKTEAKNKFNEWLSKPTKLSKRTIIRNNPQNIEVNVMNNGKYQVIADIDIERIEITEATE